MPETSNRLELLFAAAIEVPPEERAAFLDQECGEDQQLRERLAGLLKAHDRSRHPLDEPANQFGDLAATQIGASELVGTVIAGRYKLLEEIGEGGMGTVWVAEQTEPVTRKVALKLIKAGMDSRNVLARFEAERQALAMMDHPNIAKVLDGGITEHGRPYFVMEYVKGVPITDYCDQVRLSVPERLHLFIQVCSAVQHAHQKGIIHRDLKPSNILVAPYDDKPVPKVIDFGLAKALHQRLTQRTLHTAHETVIGTPLYMSPEQAQLNNLDVDTRSDIYSLGVLLYELLTGTTPLEKGRFKEAAWDEIRRIIREEEPPRPSTRLTSTGTLPSLAACRQTEPVKLTQQLRGELDWIVMKSLEKERTRRYETANGLSRDIERYLTGETVEACPPTLTYRLQKVYRKHRVAVLTSVSFGIVLLLASVVSLGFGILAKQAQQRAQLQEQLAEENANKAIKQQEFAQEKLQEATVARLELEEERGKLIQRNYASAIQLAASRLREQELTSARQILEETQEDLRGWEWNYLYRNCQSHHLVELDEKDENTLFKNMSYSPDGTSIVAVEFNWNSASVGMDISRPVKIWDAESGKYRFTLCDLKGVESAEFSPVDSQKILTAHGTALTVWDVTTRQPLFELQEENGFRFYWAQFSPDGNRIVASARDETKKKYVITIYEIDRQAPPVSHKLMEMDIAANIFSANVTFSSDGRWLLVHFHENLEGTGTGRVRRLAARIIDSITGDELLAIPIEEYDRGPIPNEIRAVKLSPDCSRLAVAYKENVVRIWKVENKASRPVLVDNPISLAGDFRTIKKVEFSHDSQRILTADHETLTIWNSSTGNKLSVLRCSVGSIRQVYFSPDGHRLLVHGLNHLARIYTADPATDEAPILTSRVFIRNAKFASNGRSILATGRDTSMRNFDAGKVLNAETLDTLYEKQIDSLNPYPIGPQGRSTFSPNGRWLAWVDGNLATLVDVATGQELEPIKGETEKLFSPVFSPNESLLLLSNNDGTISAWDVATRKVKFRIGEQHRDEKGPTCGYFTPDGSGILVEQLSENSENIVTIGALTLHSAVDGRILRTLELNEPIPYSKSLGAFSADGTRYVGCYQSSDPALDGCRVWDVKTGVELCRFDVDMEYVYSVEFSPDGKRIVTTHFKTYDNCVRFWFADSGIEIIRLQGEPPQNGWPKVSTCFSPDGNKMLVCCGWLATIWDGSPVTESKSK